MTWAIPPTDGIANDEDIAYLRNWLDGFQDQASDPLSELDQSELQSKKTNSVLMQRTIDPYGNLWGESYSVESVQSATHVTSESLSGNLFLYLERIGISFRESAQIYFKYFDPNCTNYACIDVHRRK